MLVPDTDHVFRWIAAIALIRDATVLTRNAVDFGRVPMLQIEDGTV
jgi:predicted nucleic acid-binding protein